MQCLTGPFCMEVIVTVLEYFGSIEPIHNVGFRLTNMCPCLCLWTFFGGDLYVASSLSVFMLIVIELCTDTKFPMCESESMGVFPIVARASLALATKSCEQSFLYSTLAT